MDKKLKIAIVVYSLKTGGLERVVSNQTFMFDALGFEVELFILENEISFPCKGKLHVFNLDVSDNLFVKMKKYVKVRNKIQQSNFDFILDHRYRLGNFMETFWLKFIYKNQRLLYFIHSGVTTSYVNFKIASASNIQFISVSKGIESKVKFLYPNIKIQTIYNYVEVSENENQLTELPESYILAAGRMDKSNVKQFDVLIDCYSKSNLPKQNIKLLILGSGPLMESLKQQALNLKLDNLVVFKGFVSDLFSYYKNAKFFVLSSKNEGLPTVLIESLICETPVISYDCEFGPNEIIQDRINGLLVENQNSMQLIEAMNLFISDSDLYQNCKQNAVNSVLKFSEKSIADEWIQFFNDKR